MDKYIGLSDLAQFIGTFSEMQSKPAEVFRNKCALRMLHLQRQEEEQKPLQYSSDEEDIEEEEEEESKEQPIDDFFVGRVDENDRILPPEELP